MSHGPSPQTVKKEFLKPFQIFLKQDLVGAVGGGAGIYSQTRAQMNVS